MTEDQEIFDRLFSAAAAARGKAHAHYSGFKVGAAIITVSGKIYSGCNIESSSYGLSMCAERNALSAALCAGENEFRTILIVADTPEPVSPCGACRQLIYDYAPDINVIMTNLNKRSVTENITVLLKYPFGLKKI
ncbi:MAG: cytidine deaminase [Candidatus Delongbacteria bacterium]|nr:cytidine deaminase [Candidatus Delongbacteria bacterium]